MAPCKGTVAALAHAAGDRIAAGEPVVVLEAMKMEHEVVAERAGTLARLAVAVGDAVEDAQLLAVLHPAEAEGDGDRGAAAAPTAATARARDDLAAVAHRHALGLDARRPEPVAARHAQGRRTARENLAALLDDSSLVEYGPLVFAAQERRRSRAELIERTPADGLVAGTATIDGDPCVALAYDYTVLAGTQGMRNHLKCDRLFELAAQRRLPVVLFAEGGGGRPGDVDMPIVAGLDVRAFALFARLSGLVPLVGIGSGYTFAGNAALLGCCDVVIATEDSSIGMGGPAMIEGGGLGTVAPREVGPIGVQDANGVVDIRVADDVAAVAAARAYLGFFARTPQNRPATGNPPSTRPGCAISCPASASASTTSGGSSTSSPRSTWSCAAASLPA